MGVTSPDFWHVRLLSLFQRIQLLWSSYVWLKGTLRGCFQSHTALPLQWDIMVKYSTKRTNSGSVGWEGQGSFLSKLLQEHQLLWGTHFINHSLNSLHSEWFGQPHWRGVWPLEKEGTGGPGATVCAMSVELCLNSTKLPVPWLQNGDKKMNFPVLRGSGTRKRLAHG